jgi:hypothetical protein
MTEYRTRMIRAKNHGRCRGRAGAPEIFNVEYRTDGEWILHSQYLSRGEANMKRHWLEREERCGRGIKTWDHSPAV